VVCFLQVSPPKSCVQLSCAPYMPCAPTRSSLSWYNSHNVRWLRSMMHVTVHFPLGLLPPSLFRPKHLAQHQVSHPYKLTGKITVVFFFYMWVAYVIKQYTCIKQCLLNYFFTAFHLHTFYQQHIFVFVLN
jgi:hypothetical protein